MTDLKYRAEMDVKSAHSLTYVSENQQLHNVDSLLMTED